MEASDRLEALTNIHGCLKAQSFLCFKAGELSNAEREKEIPFIFDTLSVRLNELAAKVKELMDLE